MASRRSGCRIRSADFIVNGEPEAALRRFFAGETLSGMALSPQIDDLDSLPFPRWEPLVPSRRRVRPVRGPPLRRIAAGARVEKLPGVLHLLSASHRAGYLPGR
jgi:hypothetical protein